MFNKNFEAGGGCATLNQIKINLKIEIDNMK